MHKSLFAIAASAVVVVLGTGPSFAQNTPGVDWRQNNQSHRIFHGVKNGSLTFRETGQLIKGHARIHRFENRAKSDGVVTPRERVRLHKSLNQQSRRIYRGKHN